ncbi:putative mitochondrial carrier domain-containing protein [Medicago truncatula]|uniref:Putative mitochondrial carrier domain-containing protein n=1 Tax=Medicago truncatula TaxID=3880 RepID=A0A396GNP6_MEDTR|nr:putative mitochondrial carrier domain-containing protein [Medicago truncatula]
MLFLRPSFFRLYGLVCRYQSQRPDSDGIPRYKNSWHVVKETARFEGLPGFYKGITPSLLKHIPISSISFVVYENVLKLLKLASRNDWVFSFYFMMFLSFSRFWCYKICDPTMWTQFLNMTAFLPHVPSFSCPRLDTLKFDQRNFCTFLKSDIFLTFVL